MIKKELLELQRDNVIGLPTAPLQFGHQPLRTIHKSIHLNSKRVSAHGQDGKPFCGRGVRFFTRDERRVYKVLVCAHHHFSAKSEKAEMIIAAQVFSYA